MAAMTIWRGKDPLILASQSRARQMLLANAGIPFEAIPADINERAVHKASGLAAPGVGAVSNVVKEAFMVLPQHASKRDRAGEPAARGRTTL